MMIIACQLAFHRNKYNLKLQQLFSVWFKGKAVPAKVMDLLSICGLSMGYSWSCKTIAVLSCSAMAEARAYIKTNGGYMLHDNVRITYRKQTHRINNQTHGNNGTAATLIAM